MDCRETLFEMEKKLFHLEFFVSKQENIYVCLLITCLISFSCGYDNIFSCADGAHFKSKKSIYCGVQRFLGGKGM